MKQQYGANILLTQFEHLSFSQNGLKFIWNNTRLQATYKVVEDLKDLVRVGTLSAANLCGSRYLVVEETRSPRCALAP